MLEAHYPGRHPLPNLRLTCDRMEFAKSTYCMLMPPTLKKAAIRLIHGNHTDSEFMDALRAHPSPEKIYIDRVDFEPVQQSPPYPIPIDPYLGDIVCLKNLTKLYVDGIPEGALQHVASSSQLQDLGFRLEFGRLRKLQHAVQRRSQYLFVPVRT